MMGSQDDQRPLDCVVDLVQRVPANHPLRLIRRAVDFSFVRAEVAPFYGYNGNKSVDPEVILKLLFLVFLNDLPSERELMRQVAYRLDYPWFLGMSLNDPVPDHSVLFKARARWGGAVFEKLFVPDRPPVCRSGAGGWEEGPHGRQRRRCRCRPERGAQGLAADGRRTQGRVRPAGSQAGGNAGLSSCVAPAAEGRSHAGWRGRRGRCGSPSVGRASARRH